METKSVSKETQKLGPFALGAVFMAYFCSITAVLTGGLVGQGANFITGIGGILLGFAIGAALIALSTLIGYKTGLSLSLRLSAAYTV